MNRLNLGSAYYNALEAAATKRYSNGVMFAVNYTWMKLEDQVNFFTNYDTEPYRDIQGDQRRHRLVDHDAHRSAVRTGQADSAAIRRA